MKYIAFIILILTCSLAFSEKPEHEDLVRLRSALRFPSKTQSPIKLSITLKGAGDDRALEVSLTNTSEKIFETYPWALPWGSPSSLTLVAIAQDGSIVGGKSFVGDNFATDTVKIRSGETIKGEYPISKGLKIEGTKGLGDLLLIWVYSPVDVSEPVLKPQPRLSGVVLIPGS